MRTEDLHFKYPPELVATEPNPEFRTLYVAPGQAPNEISKQTLFQLFERGDVLAINETAVLKRRVVAANNLEILFLEKIEPLNDGDLSGEKGQGSEFWQVLCPARELKNDEEFALPGGMRAKLFQRGLPQILQVSQPLAESYFTQYGELALPPYIQKARGDRRNREQENKWYQTAWAKTPGSYAAPTASLHFTADDLLLLQREYGVRIVPFVLHVGLGTFLPIKSADLEQHQMHREWAVIPQPSIQTLNIARSDGKKIWALGTTATRTLESWGQQKLQVQADGSVSGFTDLFIKPGYQFQVVDRLLTNFHQPESTLLALVAAFSDLETVKNAYQIAIEKKFRLFSYGDLTLWSR